MTFTKLYYFIILFVLVGCNTPQEKKQEELSEYIPLPAKVIEPSNNPSTPDKIKLGKLLFYDPILSGNKDVACATCHHPDYGYAENLDLSIGVNGFGIGSSRRFKSNNQIPIVKRNAHTVLNSAYNGMDVKGNYHPDKAPMFWDNRAHSLEEQALKPILSLEEMRGDQISENHILDTIVNRLHKIKAYQNLFALAFPENSKIDSTNILKAIASFERSLTTPNSRFDKFIAGDKKALSEVEKQGFELFKKAKCNLCHSGPMFSDFKIHALGVIDNEKLGFSDDGFDKTYGFRTPTLRNLRHTAPYMHNGKLTTLKKVLEFYEDISNGKSQNPNITQLDPLVNKIELKGKDMSPIISFFNSLNSEDYDKTIPQEVPSKLPVGGNIH
ncbi:cytochrome-c peroxidase [Wenyingzhuangia aestuarii]|uniref:cytochrome-c peroxidase n=1 Tax=Wenyingzhuangia aestuarii TaxID=1647582 RepID=UPI00143C8234|nr:cytochrome c peroxidase [Wenyingzhuangia aestuarii]NJB82779.1 cytochrome c peroxidase [Wenyingzhuangia aestuarii]